MLSPVKPPSSSRKLRQAVAPVEKVAGCAERRLSSWVLPPLSGSRVTGLMLFAEDTHAVAAWWAAAFGCKRLEVERSPQGDFVFFDASGVEFGVHAADGEKNPLGGTPVVYFSVPSVDAAREQLIQLGATMLRGPLVVDADRSICQLRDPFGNVFGLDGPE